MGGGSWKASDWGSFSSAKVAGRATSSIYTAHTMTSKFDPKDVMRESCDSVEHPLSTPIILGLDVTGSMSRILKVMAEKLGVVMTEIYSRNPVSDPQILFAAVGDSVYDDYPLQVTQFESDIRIAEQLTEVYFEQGGGGNSFESYPLVWYFAVNHTKCDNYEKRNKKGFLFTFGDDGYPSKLKKEEILNIFGDVVEKDVSIEDILTQVNREFEVYHFCMTQGGSHRDEDYRKWQEILGERAIKIKDYTKIPEIIVSILETYTGKDKEDIISSWDGSTSVAVADALAGLSVGKVSDNELVEF